MGLFQSVTAVPLPNSIQTPMLNCFGTKQAKGVEVLLLVRSTDMSESHVFSCDLGTKLPLTTEKVDRMYQFIRPRFMGSDMAQRFPEGFFIKRKFMYGEGLEVFLLFKDSTDTYFKKRHMLTQIRSTMFKQNLDYAIADYLAVG